MPKVTPKHMASTDTKCISSIDRPARSARNFARPTGLESTLAPSAVGARASVAFAAGCGRKAGRLSGLEQPLATGRLAHPRTDKQFSGDY
jgi:hypothetical protein